MTYGCFDRAPLAALAFVQDGWIPYEYYSRIARMVEIPDPMTKSCQYQADDKYGDKGCIGCKWKEANEK